MTSISSAALVAVALAAGVASAQQPAASPPPYRSAFDGYRPFTDEPVAPWRGTNDTVRDIGGWRAYAREAQAQTTAPAPVSAASGPQRAASAHQH